MTAVLTLGPVLDLRAAEPLKAELLSRRGKAVALDASGVDRLGGLSLQVLLSARKTWAADGQPFTVQAASDAFATQWEAFGASPLSPTGGALA
ncbi:STAS domain-containing protein [Brevundimonas sp. PAMC22021]|uniref:STAS domain-containing protein n=1 Tax=Brevundimonas sp. PAMC22021 TaxID=2861285 RepID=UPI001C6288D0|nr:STAS domain-containing protein [Brevundimonas sp. PAMC22021]QYF86190.1 STAS domain-containing protein [Brevundimonas sp. PAMC22021]